MRQRAGTVSMIGDTMADNRERRPSRWQSRTRALTKRTTLRDKQAVRHEYETRMAQGEQRKEILADLANRLSKDEKRIEGYIHDATQAEEERILSRAQRVRTRLDRRQTVHEAMLRQMARRLGEQVTLPPSHDIFSVSRDNRYWFSDRLSWTLRDDGKVKVFLPLEHDEDARLPYRSLMEHLSAAGFSSVAPDIAQWKKRAADYLAACYAMCSVVAEEVEVVLGAELVLDCTDRPAVLTAFPLTVCFDAVERAKGTAVPLGMQYSMEKTSRALTRLRFGAYVIAVGTSVGDVNHYQSEHYDLRNKHAASRRVATLAAAATEAAVLGSRVRDNLRRFASSTPLPGDCTLCRPPTP